MQSMKCSVFIATSLDGFIARRDGNIDWLMRASAGAPKGEDFGYGKFLALIDVLVMGRNTFERVLGFDEWPYGDKRIVVLSSRAIEIPAPLAASVTSSAESPGDLVGRLSAEGAQHLYIDGGVTIQRFLAAGLIDELTITVIPVLLGEGKPLFGPLDKDIPLSHIATRTFDIGFVQLVYRLAKEGQSGVSGPGRCKAPESA
jgi:dihydrofolate reductase